MYNFYPKTNFKISDFSTIRVVDITVSARLKKLITEYEAIAINPYRIQNGERPDTVSKRLYDSPYYDYIILMVNNITNIYDEWPKDSDTFNQYLIEKYGSIDYARNNYAYYYTGKNHIVSHEFWDALSDPKKYRETYLQYETRLNDQKSLIRVIDYPYIVKFESDIPELLNQ